MIRAIEKRRVVYTTKLVEDEYLPYLFRIRSRVQTNLGLAFEERDYLDVFFAVVGRI